MGLLCPNHADTAFTFNPLCSQWRAQLCRRLWLPGPLTPIPVATVTRPAAAIPRVIHWPRSSQKIGIPYRRPGPWAPTRTRPPAPDGPGPRGSGPLAFPHRDGRRGGGKVQVPPLWIERLRLAQRGAPQQEGKQPGQTGGYGGQDLPDLFRGPVVGEFAGGHTSPILQWQSSQAQSAIQQAIRLGSRAYGCAKTRAKARKMADFRRKSAITPGPADIGQRRRRCRRGEALSQTLPNIQDGPKVIAPAIDHRRLLAFHRRRPLPPVLDLWSIVLHL